MTTQDLQDEAKRLATDLLSFYGGRVGRGPELALEAATLLELLVGSAEVVEAFKRIANAPPGTYSQDDVETLRNGLQGLEVTVASLPEWRIPHPYKVGGPDSRGYNFCDVPGCSKTISEHKSWYCDGSNTCQTRQGQALMRENIALDQAFEVAVIEYSRLGFTPEQIESVFTESVFAAWQHLPNREKNSFQAGTTS